MSAAPRWASLRYTVLEDARLGTGEAHLESPEVPRWITEAGDHDIAGALCEALSGIEGKDRGKLCALLDLLCEKGDEIAQRKSIDLLDIIRVVLTDYCVKQAQKMVDLELL